MRQTPYLDLFGRLERVQVRIYMAEHDDRMGSARLKLPPHPKDA
jgi:hypothetical protein